MWSDLRFNAGEYRIVLDYTKRCSKCRLLFASAQIFFIYYTGTPYKPTTSMTSEAISCQNIANYLLIRIKWQIILSSQFKTFSFGSKQQTAHALLSPEITVSLESHQLRKESVSFSV